MDPTYVHLLLNHFPIIGTLIGLGLLLYGLLKKNGSIEKAGLTLIVLIALIAIPVFLSGEGAEETVEELAGVSEHHMEEHEEWGEIAFWLMMATGVAALGTLLAVSMKSKGKQILRAITVLLGIGTFVIMAITANYGGQIRHSEIRGEEVERKE